VYIKFSDIGWVITKISVLLILLGLKLCDYSAACCTYNPSSFYVLYSGILLQGQNTCDAVKITLGRNICSLNICENFVFCIKNIEQKL